MLHMAKPNVVVIELPGPFSTLSHETLHQLCECRICAQALDVKPLGTR